MITLLEEVKTCWHWYQQGCTRWRTRPSWSYSRKSSAGSLQKRQRTGEAWNTRSASWSCAIRGWVSVLSWTYCTTSWRSMRFRRETRRHCRPWSPSSNSALFVKFIKNPHLCTGSSDLKFNWWHKRRSTCSPWIAPSGRKKHRQWIAVLIKCANELLTTLNTKSQYCCTWGNRLYVHQQCCPFATKWTMHWKFTKNWRRYNLASSRVSRPSWTSF